MEVSKPYRGAVVRVAEIEVFEDKRVLFPGKFRVGHTTRSVTGAELRFDVEGGTNFALTALTVNTPRQGKSCKSFRLQNLDPATNAWEDVLPKGGEQSGPFDANMELDLKSVAASAKAYRLINFGHKSATDASKHAGIAGDYCTLVFTEIEGFRTVVPHSGERDDKRRRQACQVPASSPTRSSYGLRTAMGRPQCSPVPATLGTRAASSARVRTRPSTSLPSAPRGTT